MNNTLQGFYSKDNIQLLYDSLQQAIKDSLHYQLTGDQYMKQLMQIMQMKVQSTDVSNTNLNDLNKRVMDDAIPLFIQLIQSQRAPPPSQSQQQLPMRQRPVATRDQGINSELMYSQSPQQQTTMQTMYNKLLDDRSPMSQGQQIQVPNFQIPIPENQPNVNDIYQMEDQRRRESDIIPPPNGSMQLPAGFTQYMRNSPTQYAASLQQQPEPEHFQNVSLQQGWTPPQRSSVPQQQDQVYQFDDQVQSMNTFDARNDNGIQDPPQPAQMRVLIPKTSRNTVHESDMIPQIFTLDSRDRDDVNYPDPAKYRIRIPEFHNVVSIELVAAEIPFTGYTVNTSNNVLTFQEEDNINIDVEIPPGNYTADQLATAIEDAMNAATGFSVTYSVTNDEIAGKFTIEATGGTAPVFNLIFYGGTQKYPSSNEINEKEVAIYESNSIGPVIGFDKIDRTGDTSYTGQFRYNLLGPKDLYLHIEEAHLLQSNESHVHDSFAKIALNVTNGETVFYNRNTNYPFIRYFSSDLGTLSHLTIEWRTYDGQLYDFNGNNHNHVLTFEIITKDITKSNY